MKNNKLVVIVLTVFVFMLSGILTTVTAYSEGAALSVKAILPENQFNKQVSYYYLKVAPGDKQDLEVEIFNSSDEEVTALVTLTAATTNDNGMIDYNLPDKKLDASMVLPFTEIAKTPKEVKVPAGKSVITKITLELPANTFEGMILGGINIRAKKVEDKEDKESSGGMKIVNEMNYALGVVLIEEEALVKTNMLYGKTKADQVMGNNTIKANVRNDTPAVIEELSIEAQVFRDGSNDVLYENKKEGYRMAPNSNFDFGIPLGAERYRAGKYRIKVVATSDPKNPEKEGEKQVWTFDETFNITSEEARKLNASAVDLGPNYRLYYIIGGIAAAAIILLIACIVWLRKRKKKAQEAKRKKRKTNEKSKNSKKYKKKNSSR